MFVRLLNLIVLHRFLINSLLLPSGGLLLFLCSLGLEFGKSLVPKKLLAKDENLAGDVFRKREIRKGFRASGASLRRGDNSEGEPNIRL